MKFLAGLFAIFGLALHLRLYKVFSDPVLSQHLDSIHENGSTIFSLILLLAIPLVPLSYYVACFAYCFINFRNKLTMLAGVIVLAVSTPYFLALHNIAPSTAKMCLYAGGFSIANHLSQTFTKSNPSSGPLLDESYKD